MNLILFVKHQSPLLNSIWLSKKTTRNRHITWNTQTDVDNAGHICQGKQFRDWSFESSPVRCQEIDARRCVYYIYLPFAHLAANSTLGTHERSPILQLVPALFVSRTKQYSPVRRKDTRTFWEVRQRPNRDIVW